MSDELRNDEIEVEGHFRKVGANDESAKEGEAEVEGHYQKVGANDEKSTNGEVEGHARRGH